MQPPPETFNRPTIQSAPVAVAVEEKDPIFIPPVLALVVDSSPANSWPIISVLADYDFRVTSADTFQQAKARLAESPPALIVTELRLREYNGLQLVLRGKSRRPTMGAIVLSTVNDLVLQTEAEAMGATFVVRPIEQREFIAAAFRTLLRSASRSPASEPIRAPFERRTSERSFYSIDSENLRRDSERRRDHAALMAYVARMS